MNWNTILPWAFTLLCPLSMLWCMWSMRGQQACHAKSAAGVPNDDAAREIRQLKARLAEIEARQAEFSPSGQDPAWSPR